MYASLRKRCVHGLQYGFYGQSHLMTAPCAVSWQRDPTSAHKTYCSLYTLLCKQKAHIAHYLLRKLAYNSTTCTVHVAILMYMYLQTTSAAENNRSTPQQSNSEAVWGWYQLFFLNLFYLPYIFIPRACKGCSCCIRYREACTVAVVHHVNLYEGLCTSCSWLL